LKEFFIVVFFVIWFILSGVLATIFINYFNLSDNWSMHIITALIIAFFPLIAFWIYKSKTTQKASNS